MQNHHHSTVTRPRAEKRQDYARLYVCVRVVEGSAMCDTDGKLLAFADWSDASTAAGKVGMIVVNWQGFLERYLSRMATPPPAARLIVRGRRGDVRKYHAELDASPEELRTLNQFDIWEVKRIRSVKDRLEHAKVWLEASA
jgi:hypothetical protein